MVRGRGREKAMSLKTAGRLEAEVEQLQALLKSARKAAFEAGYRIGYFEGRLGEYRNEQALGLDPTQSYEIWIEGSDEALS
tara:strand:- start:136 stop:378 length:243 start_codon:yes stop_codon:yes gene_type:complete